MSIDAFYFGLNDGKIAVWTATTVYGTAVDVESIEMFGFNLRSVSGELLGDDALNDVHAATIAINGRIKFGFKSLDVISIITGESVVDSTPTSKSMLFDRTKRPYFAIAGRVDATEGGGDFQLFLPKCKVTGDIGWGMQYGQYVTPEMEFTAVYEGSLYKIGKLVKHATAQTVTIPIT